MRVIEWLKDWGLLSIVGIVMLVWVVFVIFSAPGWADGFRVWWDTPISKATIGDFLVIVGLWLIFKK